MWRNARWQNAPFAHAPRRLYYSHCGFCTTTCCIIATNPGRLARIRQRSDPPAGGLAAGAKDLDIEVADLLAQRIAVDAKKVGGANLVAAGRGQRHRQQRLL